MRRAICWVLWMSLVGWAWGQQVSSNPGAVPSVVRFSGNLTDANGKPLGGLVGVTFSLYADEQGGAPLWVETQNVAMDRSGHYSVVLGSASSTGLPADIFVAGKARWLGVQATGQAEQPRVLLASVPYAMKAGDAQTIGGLPPSAFVLAAPGGTGVGAASSQASSGNAGVPPVGGSGTKNFIPIWTDSTGDLGNSAVFQSGSGSTAKIGINTSKPAAALDVKGGSTIRGLLSLPSAGTATSTGGKNSEPLDQAASAFNSSTNTAVLQVFQWQAEPVGNNTSKASGSLNLLFAQGSGKPVETGLNIASNGQITFAAGQAFPGTGTVTSVGSGLGLTGGPVTSSGTLGIDTSVVPQLGTGNNFTGNQMVNGNVSASQLVSTATTGTSPLQVTSTTQVPNLNASFLDGLSASAFQVAGAYATLGANTFSGTQIVSSGDVYVQSGNLDLAQTTGAGTGTITLDSARFIHACCSVNAQNTFVGVDAGNFTGTGTGNTATGAAALSSNSTGYSNTAIGANALFSDTTGNSNTASGSGALDLNTTGSYNTAAGVLALSSNSTGFHNTADGSSALTFNTTGNDNTGSGFAALSSNTTGVANTASGGQALVNNTTGSWNTASGDWALFYNSTGSSNVALGYAAGNTTNSQATTGSSNTFVGANSGPGTQTFLSNATAIGANASAAENNALVLGSIMGVNGATASVNVGIGTTTPASTLDVHGTGNFTGLITFASGQTFPGTGTITGVTAGTDLTGGGTSGPVTLNVDTTKVITGVTAGTDLTGGGIGGVQTLNLDTTKVPQLAAANTFTAKQTISSGDLVLNGGNIDLPATTNASSGVVKLGGYSLIHACCALSQANTFMGLGAGSFNVTGTLNTGTGFSALASVSSGYGNTADGYAALQNNTTGFGNTAAGWGALGANTTASGNTAFGTSALVSNTTGSGTAVGFEALYSNTTGSNNTATGTSALVVNTIGSQNTATGVGALYRNTTGFNNTALGFDAGLSNVGGNYNTFLGFNSNLAADLNNATAIGANAQVTANNALVLGGINGINNSNADTNVGIGTTAPATTLDVVSSSTYAPLFVESTSGFGTWMQLNNSSSGGKNWAILSAGAGNAEGAGNLGITNFTGTSTIYLEGNVVVGGNLSKGGGSFKIDHPLDPANKFLYHSFVESPDMMDVYNGNVITSKRGLATVVLPDYFEALNRDFRYQLTVIGQFAQAMVAKEISRNRFTIKTNKPGVKVSWQVTGIRQDAYANAHRIPVEEEKPPQEQGHYLHPELFGATRQEAIGVSVPSATLAAERQ